MATETERNAIRSHLFDYADEVNCRILAARDYGSRARGIHGPDSDYDVMFVFAQPPSEYAIGADTQTYDTKIDESDSYLDREIELHGWNLKTFIGTDGIGGSNPTAMEFVFSNERYVEPQTDIADDMDALLDHAHDQFKPYALINHYRSMAAGNYGKYIEGDYTLAEDVSYDDLLTHADPPWGGIAEDAANHLYVDEEATQIGEEQIDVVGNFEWALPLGSIDTDRALDRGLIEPTTTDPTVKRHLNVAQALLRARFVEETHEPPTPMNLNEFLRRVAESDGLSEQMYATIGDLIVQKVNGHGGRPYEDEAFNEWVESELSRTIEPDGHVDRDTDWYTIRSHARSIYTGLRFDE